MSKEPEKVDETSKANGCSENVSPVSPYRVRTCLPVQQPDKSNVNLWSYLKQCIGKELTKISMPVQWNEPISLLQRVSEYMNYAYLLKTAPLIDDSSKRIEWIATFAVSALASNYERMGKPFNPLLGETYELERPDFRILCEQVGHHPPVTAFHATDIDGGKDFVFHGSMYPKVKFWGKSVEFQPKGVCTVELPRWDEEYTWSNVNCVIHNVIMGSLWMEQQGTMEITNQTTKHKCVLSFKPGGWFSGQDDLHVVEGFVIDRNKRKLAFLYGKWTEFLCSVDIESLEEFLGAKVEKVDPSASNLPKHAPLALGVIPHSKVLWQVDPRPDNSNLFYNFSQFTMGLNEMTPNYLGKKMILCSTDCRLRPDIRALENGDLEAAVTEKERLEIKQREYRKPFKSKKEHEWWTPKWFLPVKNEHTKEDDWKYIGNYWERSFEDSPDIF